MNRPAERTLLSAPTKLCAHRGRSLLAQFGIKLGLHVLLVGLVVARKMVIDDHLLRILVLERVVLKVVRLAWQIESASRLYFSAPCWPR